VLADDLQQKRAGGGGRQQLPVHSHDPERSLHAGFAHDDCRIGEEGVQRGKLLLKHVVNV
jgi:hypothetical protein